MTNKTFYHYCSIDSFFKIIESKSIWLSNSSVMNDFEENKIIENFFPLMYSFFEKVKFKEFIEPFYFTFKKEPLIFCLSENKDSLSQWRGYANDGKGISIGFDINQFKLNKETLSSDAFFNFTIQRINKDKKITPEEEFDQNTTFQKVIYNKLEQKKYLEKYFEKVKRISEKENFFIDLLIPIFSHNLARASIILKNHSFEEEKEWRIIHVPHENNTQGKKIKNSDLSISELKFRVSNNIITNYKILDFSKIFDSTLIPEIVIGPKCSVDEKILKDFLRSNNLEKTNIIKSQSSYK